MKGLLTFVFLLIFINGNAQLWEKIYVADSIGNGYGFANDVIQTQDNGYLMAGEIDLPTGAIRHYAHLKKVDENGTLLWEKSYGYGDVRNDKVAAVYETTNGDILIGGSTDFPVKGISIMRTNSVGDTIWKRVVPTPNDRIVTNFNLVSNFQFLSFSRNNTQVDLIKTDAAGFLIFNKTLDDYFTPKAAAELSNGDLILTGEKNGQLYLMRTDQFGDSIWTKQYQFGTGDFGSAIQPLANGEFLIGGATSGFAGFSPILAKFNANGNLVWQTTVGNIVNSTARVSDIALDSVGNILVTGSFDTDYFFQFSDGYLAKFNSNGQNSIVDTFSTVNPMDGSALIITNDGCLVVTGGNGNGYYLRKQCGSTATSFINKEKIKVAIYPNPMKNILNFSIDNEKFTNFDLMIYDINGRIIHQKNINNQYEFKNDKLGSGVYFYKLSVDNQILKSGKFIKD